LGYGYTGFRTRLWHSEQWRSQDLVSGRAQPIAILSSLPSLPLFSPSPSSLLPLYPSCPTFPSPLPCPPSLPSLPEMQRGTGDHQCRIKVGAIAAVLGPFVNGEIGPRSRNGREFFSEFSWLNTAGYGASEVIRHAGAIQIRLLLLFLLLCHGDASQRGSKSTKINSSRGFAPDPLGSGKITELALPRSSAGFSTSYTAQQDLSNTNSCFSLGVRPIKIRRLRLAEQLELLHSYHISTVAIISFF